MGWGGPHAVSQSGLPSERFKLPYCPSHAPTPRPTPPPPYTQDALPRVLQLVLLESPGPRASEGLRLLNACAQASRAAPCHVLFHVRLPLSHGALPVPF